MTGQCVRGLAWVVCLGLATCSLASAQGKGRAPARGTTRTAGTAAAPKAAKRPPQMSLTIRARATGFWTRRVDRTNAETNEIESETLHDQITILSEGTYRKRWKPGEPVGDPQEVEFVSVEAADRPYIRVTGAGGATYSRRVQRPMACDDRKIIAQEKADGTATHTVKGEMEGPGVSFNFKTQEYDIGLSSPTILWSQDFIKTTGVLKTVNRHCETESGQGEWFTVNAAAVCAQAIAAAAVDGITRKGTSPWFAESIKGKFKPGKGGSFRASGRYNYNFRMPDPDPAESTPGETVVQNASAQVQLDYELTFDEQQPELEVVIEPGEGYDRWIPEAGENEKKPGNSIGFGVKLRPAENPQAVTSHTAKFRFELLDTSQERGTCVNFPPKNKVQLGYDMQIEPSVRVPNVIGNGQEATSLAGLRDCAVKINSYDWGGYTRLKVTALVDDGREVVGYLSGQPGLQELSIPKDVNRNHVADAWEPSLRREATWDSDPIPSGQRRSGDGYTHYEEYRGFMVLKGGKQEHVRTDPDTKDLFFYDEHGLVKQHYEPFNPGQFNVHYVSPEGMVFDPGKLTDPQNRRVNFNTTFGLGASQYAMWVQRAPTADPDVAGVAICAENLNNLYGPIGNALKEPLKRFLVVRVYEDVMNQRVAPNPDPAGRKTQGEYLVRMTVMHEIGHAMGINHHRMIEQEVFGGLPPVDPMRAQEQKNAATGTTQSAGIRSCCIRYEDKADLERWGRWAMKTKYCREGETFNAVVKYDPDGMPYTDVNVDATGNPLPGPGPTYSSDDCWSQIDVKSD